MKAYSTDLRERAIESVESGKWRVKGPEIDGVVEYKPMEGGFFLIQHIDFVQGGTKIKGVEYIA